MHSQSLSLLGMLFHLWSLIKWHLESYQLSSFKQEVVQVINPSLALGHQGSQLGLRKASIITLFREQ